mmetsp:Transcript_148385/g.413423  ORF Transcript_148385/g.413423 Transcript_148385/m.413423 type:complete len:272 (+) Transcript_148385:142-957(+)
MPGLHPGRLGLRSALAAAAAVAAIAARPPPLGGGAARRGPSRAFLAAAPGAGVAELLRTSGQEVDPNATETVPELLARAAVMRGRLRNVATHLRLAQVQITELQLSMGVLALNLTNASRILTRTEKDIQESIERTAHLAEQGSALNVSVADLGNATDTLERTTNDTEEAVHTSVNAIDMQKVNDLEASLDAAHDVAHLESRVDSLEQSMSLYQAAVRDLANRTVASYFADFVSTQRQGLGNLTQAFAPPEHPRPRCCCPPCMTWLSSSDAA